MPPSDRLGPPVQRRGIAHHEVVAVLRHPGKEGLEVLGALRRQVACDLPDHCVVSLRPGWLIHGDYFLIHGDCFAASGPSAPAAPVSLRPNSSAALVPQMAEVVSPGRDVAITRSSASCWLPKG